MGKHNNRYENKENIDLTDEEKLLMEQNGVDLSEIIGSNENSEKKDADESQITNFKTLEELKIEYNVEISEEMYNKYVSTEISEEEFLKYIEELKKTVEKQENNGENLQNNEESNTETQTETVKSILIPESEKISSEEVDKEKMWKVFAKEYQCRFAFDYNEKRFAVPRKISLFNIFENFVKNRDLFIGLTSFEDFKEIRDIIHAYPFEFNGILVEEMAKTQFIEILYRATEHAVHYFGEK